jgi:hypothetical protein
LLRKNGLNFKKTVYFVYWTWDNISDYFENEIEFDSHIILYEVGDSWIDNVISEMHTCLQGTTIPDKNDSCLYCGFFKKLYVELKNHALNSK